MTSERRARLAAAIDRGRLELERRVQAPGDLATAETIALSRQLDDLIYRYLRLAPPPRRPT